MSDTKKAPPDPTQASHYVVLHGLDHHERGTVVEAVDAPAVGHPDRPGFDAEYGNRKVLRRADIPRLLSHNAVRPAGEDEAKEQAVPLPLGAGHPAPAGAHLTITKAQLDQMHARIRELESDKAGHGDEIKSLRARLAELENLKAQEMEQASRGGAKARG